MSALLLALLIAGCGGSGSSDEPLKVAEGGEVTKECSASPRSGGSLVYARQAETVTLDPYNVLGNGDIFTDEMIYQGLVRNDPKGEAEVVPGLADRWEVSSDGKTYTFHLRPGVKFSDGTPVTAEDVQFSLENFGDPEVNALLAVLATGYEKTEVVDPSTVRVQLSEPIAAFLYNIAVFPAFIVPKDDVEREGDAFWKHPVGAGPFRLEEFAQGSHVTLERNPYYWEEGKPYLDSVRFDFALESNSRILALRNGQAQIADGIPYTQVGALQSTPDLAVQQVPVPANLWMSINHEVPELADVNVRKAMQYALDRDQMNEQIVHGVGTNPNSILPEFEIDAPPSEVKPYEYDLAKAKEFMAKSKYPNGFSTTLIYPAGYEYYKQLTLLIQQEFAAIGIKLKLVELDQAANTERFYAGDYELSFPYNLGSSDVPVPDEYAGFYALPASETDGFFSFWSDPKMEKQVQKFLTTPDEGERTEQWAAIQAEFMDQTPILNILDVPYLYANQKSVCEPAVNILGANQLQLTWLAPGSAS
ncbi:MAG TPA: ABC transporter substrate-binding protein [Solirubrobacterales bacterium]|nr:ABC transporter substrate-binding protein [Solirubrobacterales bacterium]